MRVSGPVLDTDDVETLVRFYERLLGWTVTDLYGPRPGHPPGDGWGKVRDAAGTTKIEVQFDEAYQRPVWPGTPGRPGMQMHLDIGVPDLEAGVAWAVECGATVADHQPQHDVRVMLDPAGHPFCLFPDAT